MVTIFRYRLDAALFVLSENLYQMVVIAEARGEAAICNRHP